MALASKKLNDEIHKNKHQMQSISHLMNTIAYKISEHKQKDGTFYFSTTELKYAHNQIPLHIDTQKHCNFKLLGGSATGTNRFINGFYGLTEMPAKFQKAVDFTLTNIHSTHGFLDGIIRLTKGSLKLNATKLCKILKRQNEENIAISISKCELASAEII